MFVKGLASDFRSLRANPAGWDDETTERGAWETTAADGLADEPAHPDARDRRTARKPRL